MRIATGGINHESNTFSTIPTTWESFADNNGLSEGQAIFERFAETNTITCGFMEGCSEYGYELLPLIWTSATPSDAVVQEDYERLKSLMLEGLHKLGKVDGVLLDLHGAMVAKETDDVEGDLLEAVRGLVGPDTPVVATLDLHTNMTERMVQNATALIGSSIIGPTRGRAPAADAHGSMPASSGSPDSENPSMASLSSVVKSSPITCA